MAGPMVGPLLERLPASTSSRPTGCPTASSPTTSPTRCCPRTARSSSRKVRRDGRRPRHRLGRRRRPLLLHRRHGRVRRRRLPHRAAGRVDAGRSTRAPTSSTTSAPRARSPTPSRRAGGRALVNRVGHAFFKTRMRDEGGVFGGEVSGHYYFADFYNADSGTIPALLILELLGQRARRCPSCSARYRSRYFISGEINSEVADPQAKMAEIKERYADAGSARARRHLDRLRRLALQRAPLQHGAAAAPEPRVARLARGHGGQARRGAGPHPLVTDAAAAGYHCLPIPTPFAVGRVNCYLIEDDPLTLVDTGPELGQGARRARARAGRARPPRRGPRADRHHPPAHRPPRAGRHPRAPLRRRGLRARPARARDRATSPRTPSATTSLRRR